ncbi:MAG: L-threonylcarbamoyladenylate synthase [Clostridia bacterium]|nr:L-threonylcarbamoyladenylate synthase [Clostridia bacterium]
MKTVKLSANEEDIKKAAELLLAGEVVAIPTETVYGLAANAMNKKAVEKIFKAKGRPQDNPLIVHISNLKQLETIVSEIGDIQRALIKAFWPGPLTIIFKSNKSVAENVSAGLDTVAVRMPNNKTILKIIETANIPLAAPSANVSGRPSPTDATDVLYDLDGKISAVVDSGQCKVGVESTVVSVKDDRVKILRPGIITKQQIEEAIKKEVEIDELVYVSPTEESKIISPGVKYKHYSPKAEVFLVDSDFDFFNELVSTKKNALAVCFNGEKPKIDFIEYGEYEEDDEKARKLFAILRQADKRGYSEIYFRLGAKSGKGLAVYNRLLRAAAFKVIKQKNLIVGLTGPTGAGKSKAAEIFKSEGFDVIDADKISRRVIEKNLIKIKIFDTFGLDIGANTKQERQKLADKVFATKEGVEKLNSIMFPEITAEIEKYIQKKTAFGTHKFLIDAAALFESGADQLCDFTVSIIAPLKLRTQRIVQRDKITEKQAISRTHIQLLDEEYIEKSDFVIKNDKTETELKTEILKIIDKIGGKNGY